MKLSEIEELPKEILDEFEKMQADPNYGVRWDGREKRKEARAARTPAVD